MEYHNMYMWSKERSVTILWLFAERFLGHCYIVWYAINEWL